MGALAIELCDAGFAAATCEKAEARLQAFADEQGMPDWPGFAYHDGQKLCFGRAAEDAWFVHPRRVTHTFWERLAHEPAVLNVPGKVPSYSELGFHFLREFSHALLAAGPVEKVVLAVPGAYLKDAATEDEKVGLLLGMASELKLPLAGIMDMACAALCDPRAGGYNPALPVVVIDLHLEGTELSFLVAEDKLQRTSFLQLPQAGQAQLLKHLLGTMGNRFLRHAAFDILEDGRIEQIFYRQVKSFLLTGASEYRFQINTANRNYEMLAKHELLMADAQSFVAAIVHGLQNFLHEAAHAADGCTVALTHRAACVPGLEMRLRAMGFRRLLRLPAGAAACGAACVGANRLVLPADMADVPVETAVPLADTRRATGTPWETRLHKVRANETHLTPTHAILHGVGHRIAGDGRFVIGAGAPAKADLPLPESFNAAENCAIPLVREGGRLWLVDGVHERAGAAADDVPLRTAVEAGDRLTIRCGSAHVDVLFAHCQEKNGTRG
jgi:hypothetical protein